MIVDTGEIELLTGSLREVFAGADGDVPRHLRELGWDDVTAADPAAATTLLFTEKGRALSAAALLDEAVLPLLRAALPACAARLTSCATRTPVRARRPGRRQRRLA